MPSDPTGAQTGIHVLVFLPASISAPVGERVDIQNQTHVQVIFPRTQSCFQQEAVQARAS